MISYPNKVFRKEELSRFLIKSIYSIKPKKNNYLVWEGCSYSLSLALIFFMPYFFMKAPSPILGFFFPAVFFTILFFFNVVAFFYKRSKNHGLIFNSLKAVDFKEVFTLLSFSKKYNFEKIKKALDNYDFQSPHLKSFINENFSFSQKDLLPISNKDFIPLYNELVRLNMIDELKEIKRITDMGSEIKFIERKWMDEKIALKNKEVEDMKFLHSGKINEVFDIDLSKSKSLVDKI